VHSEVEWYSGGCFRSIENSFKQNCACVVEALRGLIIAHGASLCIELQEGDTGFEELLGLVQGFEFFVGRHHQFVGIALALAALGVGDGFGEQAGAVEIDVGVKVVAAKRIDQIGEALRDMAVAEVFAHDSPVLGFGLRVVVTVPRA
jgi:hypothetical protein